MYTADYLIFSYLIIVVLQNIFDPMTMNIFDPMAINIFDPMTMNIFDPMAMNIFDPMTMNIFDHMTMNIYCFFLSFTDDFKNNIAIINVHQSFNIKSSLYVTSH